MPSGAREERLSLQPAGGRHHYDFYVTLGKRVIAGIVLLLVVRRVGATSRLTSNSAPSLLTRVEIEERAESLAERREKLDYFYITAFTAILVFTFNNFNSRSGILARAPVWLVEIGWGSLIAAALCPLYVISARFKRFAMNLDEITGKEINKHLFITLRRRSDLAHRFMTLLFVIGVGSLCAAYALGLKHIGT